MRFVAWRENVVLPMWLLCVYLVMSGTVFISLTQHNPVSNISWQYMFVYMFPYVYKFNELGITRTWLFLCVSAVFFPYTQA